MERKAEIRRTTKETDIALSLGIDGSGKCGVECPVGFLFHMLDSFCRHGLFDLSGSLAGDLHVDQHHLVEDAGIALGEAFEKAQATRRGYGARAFSSFRWTRPFAARPSTLAAVLTLSSTLGFQGFRL